MSQRIYYGGNILTMDKDETSDYLITENGKIKNLGKGTPPPLPVSAERYDLKAERHACLHGPAQSYFWLRRAVFASSLESCKTNEEIKVRSKPFLQAALKAGEWILPAVTRGA
ncbi:MAG: hypothetical protein ACLRSW_06700 [Christensenellaceae bacterium]